MFSATENEIVGPFQGDAGFYVIEVEKVTPAVTQQLDDQVQGATGAQAQTVADQIRASLVANRQQTIAQAFQDDFQTKWIARTFCAEGYRIDRCSNAEPAPDPCTKDIAESQGCDAPVPSTKPIAPGSNDVFGTPAAVGLAQGPQTGSTAPAGGATPGLTPVARAAPCPPALLRRPRRTPQTAPQTAPPGG